MLFMWMGQNKSDSLLDEDPSFVPFKSKENDRTQVHLDLVMATVVLGKDHEKENLFLDQGE